MTTIPVELKTANEFVRLYHSHNLPVAGHRFSIGAEHSGELVGVCIVGRPIARMLQDGVTAEVLRVCTTDYSPKGTGSFLYSAAWRAWRSMGGRRLITSTLQDESGASLRGAGWKTVAATKEQTKNGWLNRPGRKDQEVTYRPKLRWEISLL